MDNDILPTEEFVTVEGRSYLNPSLGLTETNQFIDNLRSTQQQTNTEIAAQTQALGTEVPSNLGGLTGGESYWTSRYQTPQTLSATANLRTIAQAQALNQALANEEAIWKKRYQDAYRNYQRSAYNRSNSGGGDGSDNKGEIKYEDTGEILTFEENELVLPESTTTDTGITSAINAYAGVTGQGQVPTTSSQAGILVDKDGNRTAIRVYPGQGLEVAGGMSYNKTGARNFLSEWVKNGGQVLNFTGGGNYSTNMLAWDLY